MQSFMFSSSSLTCCPFCRPYHERATTERSRDTSYFLSKVTDVCTAIKFLDLLLSTFDEVLYPQDSWLQMLHISKPDWFVMPTSAVESDCTWTVGASRPPRLNPAFCKDVSNSRAIATPKSNGTKLILTTFKYVYFCAWWSPSQTESSTTRFLVENLGNQTCMSTTDSSKITDDKQVSIGFMHSAWVC